MASTGISPMHDPVSFIIAILPCCGSPIVNLVYSSRSRISPTVTLLKLSYFLLYTLSPIFSLFFSVLCCALRKLVDTVCLCVCWGFQEGVGQWSWQQLCSAFQALIETYCQSDTRICMQCVFQDVFFLCFFSFFLLATDHSVNHLCISYMQKCSHKCT